MGKHHTPRRRHPAIAIAPPVRNDGPGDGGLTVFVVAMIASYSGAFAKPTLHHLTVAVAGPQQVVDGIRGQDTLAVTQVADATAARRQVYERTTDAAFVVGPTGELKIYVAGGGGRSVANAAETVGRAIAAKAGLTADRRRRRPDGCRRPAGHRRVLRRHLPVDRRDQSAPQSSDA